MVKKICIGLISLLLLSSCAHRKIVIPQKEVHKVQINTWGQATNEKEEVDVSDVDEKISTINDEPEVVSKMERVPFSDSEYKKYSKNGKGTIKGNIYLKSPYGSHVVGANTRLYLNPVTSYSKQWYYESYLGGHKMQKPDSRLFNYLRFTSANEQGKFEFYGVPSGEYYLIGTVKCAEQCGYSTPKSIRIAKIISINGNQVLQKDLYKMIE